MVTVGARNGDEIVRLTLRPELAKGLRAIDGLGGLKRRILVYLGAEALRPERGIEVLPLAGFLAELERGFG